VVAGLRRKTCLLVPLLLILLFAYAGALTQFGLIQMHYNINVGHTAPVLTPSTISVDFKLCQDLVSNTWWAELTYEDPQNPLATLEVYEECYIYAVLTTSNDTNLPYIDMYVKIHNATWSKELWLAMDAPYENYALIPVGTYSVSVWAYGQFANTEATGTLEIELRYDFL